MFAIFTLNKLFFLMPQQSHIKPAVLLLSLNSNSLNVLYIWSTFAVFRNK